MPDAGLSERVRSAQFTGSHHADEPSARYGTAAAGLVVVIGFLLRARSLGTFWLNPDEGIYYSTLTHASFSEFWSEVMANAHPPAFYLLLRGLGFFTWDFVWLRGSSLLFGTLAIWIFWLVGRELGGRGVAGTASGLTAATLLAVNPQAIVLSQVLRPYMMLLALLGFALLHLLRFRRRPATASLFGYGLFMVLALLTHYSAALAFGTFCVLIGYDRFAGTVARSAWRKLAWAQAVPAVALGLLYMLHLSPSLQGDLVAAAYTPGGWLSNWLADSPGAVWRGYLGFQVFHVPEPLILPSALLLGLAVPAAALGRASTVAVLASAGLAAAVVGSSLGLYPFGPSRHDTWLVLFTLPAIGWLVGSVMARERPAALLGGGAAIILFVSGALAARTMGIGLDRTDAAEEQPIRQSDLAPVVVQRLDPDGEPALILMTEQTYNMLMPLYPAERERVQIADAGLVSFRYGSRTVVVVRRWDWGRLSDLQPVLASIPDRLPGLGPELPETLLLTAGGWGSLLFLDLEQLEHAGAIIASGWAEGRPVDGRPGLRLMASVVDSRVLLALR